MVVNIHYTLYVLRFVFFLHTKYEYFCLSWLLHEPKVQANANKNTKCLFCTPELFYLSSSNDSSYWGVRLAGQHGGDTQNKVIIIHEVLLCMLLHVLLQCYNFYIHEYSNHTRYFNLLIASHSLALQCMRLLMKKDKLHPQRNSWSHRRRGGKSLKYKCTAYFWTSRGGGGETCLGSCCVVSQGVLKYICSAGVKMRTVPSIDTVRKAQRKILSITCATNFQSWTTWMRQRDKERRRQKNKPWAKATKNSDKNNVTFC